MAIYKIQIRRDTSANFTSANPVLSSGEPALETDTRRQKIGNGISPWVSLPYMFETPVGTTDQLNTGTDLDVRIYSPKILSDWLSGKNYLTSFTETDPTVPAHVKGITSGDISSWNAAQVNVKSDWLAVTGDAEILNKPTTLAGYGITDAQETLVSGTNIKTVNGETLLGSGDVEIDVTTAWDELTDDQKDVNLIGFTDGINPQLLSNIEIFESDVISSYNHFCTNGSIIVAFDNSEKHLKYSEDDGISWADSTYNSGIPSYINDIIYAQDKFIAIGISTTNSGQTGTIFYSTDGKTWDSTSVARQANSIAYGNGRFLGVGANGSMQSTNGISWTNANPPKPFYIVQFVNGKFYGFNLTSSANSVQVSATGTGGYSWSNANIPSDPNVATTFTRPSGLYYFNGLYVVLYRRHTFPGTPGTITPLGISKDLVNWDFIEFDEALQPYKLFQHKGGFILTCLEGSFSSNNLYDWEVIERFSTQFNVRNIKDYFLYTDNQKIMKMEVSPGIVFENQFNEVQTSDGTPIPIINKILTLPAQVNVKSDWNAVSGDAEILNKPAPISLTGYALESYVDSAINNLIDSAPGTLDTLNELADALGNDPNFATTITNLLTAKADKTTTITAGTGMTGGGSLSDNRTIALNATTISDIGKGVTAEGWGNHASQGYLTSFTETDPTVPTYSKSLTAFSVIKTSTDALYTALIGDQTIAGIKTFSSSPIVPAPTTNMQAATKKYVDDAMSGAGLGDMLKSVYDTNNNGIVDNAALVNGLTVETAVPSGALFTDTTYSVFSTGNEGLVPARVGAVTTKYLREDGTWVTPTNTTYTAVTKATLDTGASATAGTISPLVLKQHLDGKGYSTQTLTAGTGIGIAGSVISVESTPTPTGTGTVLDLSNNITGMIFNETPSTATSFSVINLIKGGYALNYISTSGMTEFPTITNSFGDAVLTKGDEFREGVIFKMIIETDGTNVEYFFVDYLNTSDSGISDVIAVVMTSMDEDVSLGVCEYKMFFPYNGRILNYWITSQVAPTGASLSARLTNPDGNNYSTDSSTINQGELRADTTGSINPLYEDVTTSDRFELDILNIGSTVPGQCITLYIEMIKQ